MKSYVRVSKELGKEIANYYRNGNQSIRSISRICGVSSKAIKRQLRIAGIGIDRSRKKPRVLSNYKTTSDPVRRPNPPDISWTAGFLEGEGCFSKNRNCTVSASQVNLEPLTRLLELFGGTIVERFNNGPKKNGHIYTWHIHGKRCRDLILMIYDLMSVRRKEQIKEMKGAHLQRLLRGI